MRVVCTAGHVDHGKSTLVTALTGQHPDRLAEEQRRGLTIDLGFAWTALPGVGDVAFVDLPGHERFIPNMLAGAGSVSVALFVIAADEGWMPQSAEHLGILDLLEVQAGVVALTRTDLVDEETAEIAVELAREQLEGSGLASAEVVPVSAVTGHGLPALRDALVRCLVAAPTPEDVGRPRLWVDRSFSVRGAGTVVTGTLQGGAVTVGDTLTVLPDGLPTRVRALQALEQPVTRAEPGWRVALNLAGTDVDQVGRGDAITGGEWVTTDVVEAWCRPTAGHTLGRRGAWTVHVGTAAVPARLHPVSGRDLTGPGPVRIEMAHPLPLVVGDRLVLRESGRGVTAGGGIVLEPAPGRRVRGALARLDRQQALADMGRPRSPQERLSGLVGIRGVTPTAAALAAAGAPASVAGADGVDGGDGVDGVMEVGGYLMSAERWVTWSGLAVDAVRSDHQAHPARRSVSRDVPRTLLQQAECPDGVADAIISRLVADGLLDVVPGGIAAPGHQPRLTVAQQQARLALLGLLEAADLSPPRLSEAASRCNADSDLLEAMRVDGQLIVLPDVQDIAVSRQTLQAAQERLAALQARVGPFTAAQARDVWSTSRRFALPVLQALDGLGATIRAGDLRTVGSRIS